MITVRDRELDRGVRIVEAFKDPAQPSSRIAYAFDHPDNRREIWTVHVDSEVLTDVGLEPTDCTDGFHVIGERVARQWIALFVRLYDR